MTQEDLLCDGCRPFNKAPHESHCHFMNYVDSELAISDEEIEQRLSRIQRNLQREGFMRYETIAQKLAH